MNCSERMDPYVVRSINRLWLPVYAGIAKQVTEHFPREPKIILEIGCFSGGIGLTLIQRYPRTRLTVALDLEDLVETFSVDWEDLLSDSDAGRVELVSTRLDALDVPDSYYDLIVCRGIFFFLGSGSNLLSEIDRVLSPGGIAFAGGGFGSHTSPDLIREIADESRRLNNELGKRFFTKGEFKSALADSGLSHRSEITEEGGLWAVIRK